jgi:DHA1 family tetracycline resistance protein-like MFS transporter
MNNRRALILIFCTVTLDVLALGLMIPVLPKLVLSFMGGEVAGAAEIFGLFATVWGLMQFFFSPILGALSDRYGRRPVILLSCFGLGLDYILMALAPSLVWLFVGRVISGISAATISTSMAYIADVSPPEQRAKNFGIVGIAFGAGFIVGPAIGGLLGGLDPRLPFWVAAVACFINAGFGWFVLPESLPAEKRMAFAWKRANPIGALKLLNRSRLLMGLSGVNFLGQVAHQVLPSIFVLYAAYRYRWGEELVGLTLALVGLASALVQGLLIGPAVARLGERRAILLGLASGAIGMTIYAAAPTGGLFLLGIPILCLWGLAGPAAMALMTPEVGDSEQGQLQGANTSLNSVAGLIGPGIFAATFAWFIEGRGPVELPGAPFYVAAVLLAAAAVLAAFATRGLAPSSGRPR